jgi:LysR family hydrogen peroxide-inducible transcriptional activator
MTLTQLEYILAVHKQKHFGRAAESCFVTQPTLSMQIQKLEDELQVILFDRSKSPIKVTAEGQPIIEQAQVIIKEQKRLFSILDETKKELTGDFTLAVIPTLSPYIIPLFIQSFVKKYPKVNFQIVENKTEDIIELLKNDEVDAAVLATPLHEKNLDERVLYYEPFYLFVSNKHPYSKKSKIKEEELDINEIWLLNKGNCFRDQVLNICAKDKDKSLKNPINFESGNFETLKNMVLKGFGYTILPHMAAKELSTSHKKLLRPFKSPVPTREISLVTNKDSLKIKIVNALEEEILAYIPEDLREIKKKDLQVIDFSLP